MRSAALSILFCFLLFSCVKERSTYYRAYLKNETTHNVKLRFFANGSNVAVSQIDLTPGQQFEEASGSDRGIVDHGGFNSSYFQNVDSLQVVFDNQYVVSHYLNTPGQLARRNYLYSSTRNVLNYLSYNYTFEDVSSSQRNTTYIYTFTEADYQFAKN